MRICEINDIASVASELADGLRARGHEVDVIRPRLIGGGLPWMVKPVVGPVRAVEWAQIIHQVRSGRYDAVHIHYAYLGMIGVLGNFPYLLHCHGSDVREITPFTRPMVERALIGASHVFYSTPDLAPYVLPRRPDAEFLPNPINAGDFRPIAPARESRDVLVICSLTDIKGAVRIYQGVRRLAKERPDIRVTVIGGGEWTPRFARLPTVTVLPHQPREQLPALIARHGVVVGQVLLGVVGMAELEAMSCARPVIAWYTYNDAYAERPPFVRAVDGVDIAAAVMRFVDDAEARERVGNAGREWVRRYHNMEHTAERVEAAARHLLASR